MSSTTETPLKALVLGCSLKPSPAESSTDTLAGELIAELDKHEVKSTLVRVADYTITPGVEADMGGDDQWPELRAHMLEADILVIATPTWAGQLSSIAMKVIERLDAELSELADNGLPYVYGKVGGAVVVGNEDGAHHICATIFQALNDYGLTIPAASGVYWNGEAMNKVDYKDLDHTPRAVASATKQMAANLAHGARLLKNQPYIPA